MSHCWNGGRHRFEISCPAVVTAEFGFSQIEACEGDQVKINWQGTHNIQETANSECGSDNIGDQIIDYHDDGYSKSFKNNEMSAKPGETRYFKCTSHCGVEASRIEVSCPAVVTAKFGFSQIEACEGDTVKVDWQGYHNIQETMTSDCNSANIGGQIAEYHESGYVQSFNNNEMSAKPGETR